jgi:hypothetical protein
LRSSGRPPDIEGSRPHPGGFPGLENPFERCGKARLVSPSRRISCFKKDFRRRSAEDIIEPYARKGQESLVGPSDRASRVDDQARERDKPIEEFDLRDQGRHLRDPSESGAGRVVILWAIEVPESSSSQKMKS